MMSDQRRSTFTQIYAAGAVVLVFITIFAVTFAIQEHNDRVLADEISGTASELEDTGARVMSIRDGDLKDMNDYIRAYSQMEPLLSDYDKQLQRITDLYGQARERNRRLLRVERLYRRPYLANWESMSEILDITRALNRVLRQETSIIQNMALLPKSDRMQFWHEQFLPLEAQEKALRVKLLILGQRMSPAEQ
jgi:hypothetical protein